MAHKALAFITIITSLIFSCSYFKNVRLLTQGEIKRKHYVQTMPFELKKDLIVVKAKINHDTADHEFIFDTGAFNSKVNYELADSLGLQVVTEKENSTAQGVTRTIKVIRVDSLRLGDTWIYNIGAGKLRYDSLSASKCIARNGIIGANLMQLANWKINYENQLLYFSDNPFEQDADAIEIPFERPMLSGTPKIDIQVGGKTVSDILFDVGYNGGLILPLNLINSFPGEPTDTILDYSTSGIYGVNADSVLVKNLAVKLGDFSTNIPVLFSSLGKALLGNEFLKHFTVTIDYENNKINLIPVKAVAIQKTKTFLAKKYNDSTWVVNRTSTSLPFHLGEKLSLVNGKKPSECFNSYCDYITQIGPFFDTDSIQVVKTNGQSYTISQY